MSEDILQTGASPKLPDEFVELVVRHLEGGLTEAEGRQLNGFLADDPAKREAFVALCTHASLLASGVGVEEENDECGMMNDELSSAQVSVDIHHSSFIIHHSDLGGWLFSYGVATVITGMAILGAWACRVSLSGTGILPVQVANTGRMPVPPPKPESVGRITGMADCRWSDLQDAPSAAVPLGRKYELASGLLEITYQTGAKVILQGPCKYEVDSAAGGFLSLGKLTARVEKSEIRNPKSEGYDPSSFILHPSSLFSVRTPTAVVTDLGTEFGVEVSKEGTTTSHVFRGVVEVQVTAVGGGTSGGGVLLGENDSARVDIGRDQIVRVVRQSAKPNEFKRQMPQWIRYTFDDGTTQGWAPIPGLAGNAGHGFGATPLLNCVGVTAQSGHWYVFGLLSDDPRDFAPYRRWFEDTPHPTITFRSPPFVLDGSGDLTFYLCGGPAGGPAPANVSKIPPASIFSAGFMGMALERVSDGALVLSATVTAEPRHGTTAWQRKTFTTPQLAPFVNKGCYRLLLIDYQHGPWGWVALDTVTIPGRLAQIAPDDSTTGAAGLSPRAGARATLQPSPRPQTPSRKEGASMD